MKRKMLGAASIAMTAAALSMPAGAQAQTADLAEVKMCGPTVQHCVEGVVATTFRQVNYALQTTMDLVEAACDIITKGGCSMPLE